MSASNLIYKILDAEAWREAREAGHLLGAPVDLADGFIHFSSAAQVAETAAKHFAEESDLGVKLGNYVLGEAVAEAARWQKVLPRLKNPLFVSINVSTRQFFRQDLAHDVQNLQHHPGGDHVGDAHPEDIPALEFGEERHSANLAESRKKLVDFGPSAAQRLNVSFVGSCGPCADRSAVAHSSADRILTSNCVIARVIPAATVRVAV